MRRAWLLLALASSLALAACTIGGGSGGAAGGSRPAAPAQPTGDMMPSSVLDRQDPGADTSKNPVLSRSSSRSWLDGVLDRVFPSHAAPAFQAPEAAPHYSQGCRGCAADRSAGPSALAAAAAAAAAALAARRRRRRFTS